MILQKLEIERERWGTEKGKFKGRIAFENDKKRIEMTLPHDMSERILRVCGDALVDSAKELSSELTADCIEALPNPDADNSGPKSFLEALRG
jgi:hypothetical protein